MDPFSDQELYPQYDRMFLDHFKGLFDSVFVGFFPFFKIQDFNASDYRKSLEISLEDARNQDEVFRNITATNATIYTRNTNYPSEKEISTKGTIVTWAVVRKGAGFNSNSELCKALKTSIGAYNLEFARPDLAKKLETFVKKAKLWVPGEGAFDVLTSLKIYHTFVSLGKKFIVIVDEHYQTKRELNLNDLTAEEFTQEIGGKDYYIYSADKSILFSVDWDSFFFLICSTSTLLKRIIESQEFEGFFAGPMTTHGWEHEHLLP